MEKVVTINLGGSDYKLDEPAYDVLRAYLDLASRQLTDNPDRVEILADFERAIADKCRRFLTASKTVVTAAEMQHIVNEMGPVEGAPPAPAAGGTQSSTTGGSAAPGTPLRKRLYRIRDGAMFTGVCSGLAAYLGFDVVIVRVFVVFLTIVSHGWGLLLYWALVFIVPEAQTPEEIAAAHGEASFNAQTIIDQAKQTTAQATHHARATVENLRGSRAAWRRQWRAQRRQLRQPFWFGVLPLFGLFSVAYFVVMTVSIPPGIPFWARLVALVVLFQIIMSPLRFARAAAYDAPARPYAWLAVWDALVGVGLLCVAIWLLYTHMPPPEDAGEFIRNVPDAMRSIGREIIAWFQS